IDPAGGSGFLEALTEQLAAKAWDLLRQVEANGGMIAAARSGWVVQQIEVVEAARRKDLATRKQVVTGVSEHPDVREQRLTRPKPDPVKLRAAAATRLVAWRRDHRCDQALGALARAAGDPAPQPGRPM